MAIAYKFNNSIDVLTPRNVDDATATLERALEWLGAGNLVRETATIRFTGSPFRIRRMGIFDPVSATGESWIPFVGEGRLTLQPIHAGVQIKYELDSTLPFLSFCFPAAIFVIGLGLNQSPERGNSLQYLLIVFSTGLLATVAWAYALRRAALKSFPVWARAMLAADRQEGGEKPFRQT